jgi:DNA-binding FadR family transcriptional regulator
LILREDTRVKTTIRVNRKRPESLTKQITDQLIGLIESGAYAVGSYLPSERELANQVKVARNVIRGSYENLIRVGKIQSEGRKGRTVKSSGGRKKAGATKRKSSGGTKARKK